ncbi:PspC domain-containing protein [Thioflexithrix psekupsensis]|uniref:Phage shock protein PspC N-terminal domain-containing protein n=1 Tax=Thioflexithrix psekupsensis TaxID=1570016 RepID=A0A251X397_9GAMM|nr:PspC domain-containing protein [Thioflexithrix psekupsensis]OUD11746.1 hypothetical protein TPSD3_17000 [Thioflexithrix psekupsensis]
MNAPQSRKWEKDPDNGWIFGVCAGTANYFGISVGAVRLLTLFLFFTLMPLTSFMYISAVILLPRKEDVSFSNNEQSVESLQETLEEMEADFNQIAQRVAIVENYVTSDEFELKRRMGQF